MSNETNSNNIFLQGDRIFLRNLELNDLSNDYLGWLNDQETSAQNSHGLFPYNLAQLKQYIESTNQNKNTLVLAIVSTDSQKHIGNISLQNINWVYRSAEYAILLGDKDHWGKGLAYEASMLIMNHGFKNLNLNRIYCGTTSGNIGMKKLAIKLGMEEEGVRKEAFFGNGQFSDIIEFGVLRREFRNND